MFPARARLSCCVSVRGRVTTGAGRIQAVSGPVPDTPDTPATTGLLTTTTLPSQEEKLEGRNHIQHPDTKTETGAQLRDETITLMATITTEIGRPSSVCEHNTLTAGQ